jgi:hypothetical protein
VPNEKHSDISDEEEANFIRNLSRKALGNIKGSYPSNASTVEKLDTLLTNFLSQGKRIVMMKKLQPERP